MSLSSLLSHWRADPDIANNIVEWRTLPARLARTAPLPEDLHPSLVEALHQHSIHSLYIHQLVAWQQAKAGQNFAVVTSTASGKTLCYNLPVLDRLLRNSQARALYLFPTKALAQDQISGLNELLIHASGNQKNTQGDRDRHVSYSSKVENQHPLSPAIYDGDTPINHRPRIRTTARLILSNPDMLHTGILPHHTSWAEFFRNLEIVVIDEMHTYRGVFGSHVANVIRRLKRITRFYGASPQFILTSATIANPIQLAEWLVEESISLVDDDGSARGPRNFLIYNPPILNKELGIRRSVLQESVRLAEDLITSNVQTLIFGRTRRGVELILLYLREQVASLPDNAPFPKSVDIDEAVRGYRSGYLPGQRREIEHGLRDGQVRAVVATNALELGIDIGGMGAALLAGYPGTIASTWQQAGRAGRGEETSLAILMTSADPLDQFLARHPDYFFKRTPEQALINPDNLLILLGHLRCAAFELPFAVGEKYGQVDPVKLEEFLEFLRQEGSLHLSGMKYFWMADKYPAEGVSLRSTTPDTVVLQDDQDDSSKTIGKVDIPSAHWMVHPGAVYIHEGNTYLVEELDLDNKIAHLKSVILDYYTEPRKEVSVQLIEKQKEEEIKGGVKALGEIIVTSQMIGFRKVRWNTHETLGFGEVSLPPTELQTIGYWVSLFDSTVDELRAQGLWTNATNEYGPQWSNLRDQVRRRDGFRCQVCGSPEGERAHDVHHKKPFKTFASIEQANHLSNLITLCQACHRRVELAVRIRTGLSGLSFTIANLSPLFLMCDTRDLGVHSDPQSSLSGGKPTLVIYDQIQAGIGFSERLYEIHAELFKQAYELVKECPCLDGCPSCVGPGGENGSGGKKETLAMLELLITA